MVYKFPIKMHWNQIIYRMGKIKKTLFLVIILILLSSCKAKTVFVPVKETKIEYKDRLRVDSIYNRDTVSIYQKNDTVFLEKIKWRERFKNDTVSVLRVDSIPYPIEVVKEVNVLTKWQEIRLKSLNIILLILGTFLIIKLKF